MATHFAVCTSDSTLDPPRLANEGKRRSKEGGKNRGRQKPRAAKTEGGKNRKQTELAEHFKINEEDSELVGQQCGTGAGPTDILAIRNDGHRLLVAAHKRGRASAAVVGQILRYMGHVKEQITERPQ